MRASSWVVHRWVGAVVMTMWAGPAAAQQPAPPSPAPPANDTPAIRIGMTLYADYTYTTSPETIDTDGNTINPSVFNVGRSYLNVTGSVSRIVAFRITPDIARETGAGSSLNGSLTFRIKYAFAQFNLDDWVTPGSWARLGIQQTPWVEFEESVYRYRFQGTVFSEREGFLSSADGGASFRYNLPSNYGEVHVGVYNGENYNKLEVNDRKAIQMRGTVRPFAANSIGLLRGLRAHLFYDGDHYIRDAERRRFIGSLTFEHQYFNAGFDYLSATDQTSIAAAEVDSRGYSIWVTPRSPSGWEVMLRFDHLTSNTLSDSRTRNRTIVGIAYWFPHQSNVSSALLFDYDGATSNNFAPAQPKEQRVAVHGLVNF